jgi:hypothetical protein
MYSSMKIACLLLAFAVCVCQGQGDDGGNLCRNFTNQNILDILEELRDRMGVPLPRFNIPILEPLAVENISLSNFTFLEGLDIQMYNLSFAGFSRFQTFGLDLNVIGFFLDLQLVIPELEITGFHVSNGTLFGLIPVIGEGTMNLTIHNVTFDVSGQLNHTGIEWYSTQLSLNLTIANITGDGFNNLTDPFFNDVLRLSGPEILELTWPSIAPAVEEVVAEAAATFMNYFSLVELMGMLHGEGMDWSDGSTTTPAPSTTPPISTTTTAIRSLPPLINYIMEKKAAK